MNNARRKEIDRIIAMIEGAKSSIEEIKDAIETIKDEEEEYRDNLPENLQQSEKADKANTACDELDNAHSTIDGLDLDEIISNLEAARDT